MASKVAIYNMALGHVGNTQLVELATEQTVPATTCTTYWDAAVGQILTDYPWPFAKRFVALALISDDFSDDWQYSYRFPTEAVAVRRLTPGTGRPAGVAVPYEVASDDDGRLVLSNESDATAEITKRETEPGRYPDDFAFALSYLLAHYIATPLARERPQLREAMLVLYRDHANRAFGNAMNQQASNTREAEWITARDA